MDEAFEVKERVRSFLSTSERLLWSGKPQQGFVLRANDVFIIPFGLFWTFVTVGGGIAAARESVLGVLFLAPFLLAGSYLLVGRFWLDARQRHNTLYAVTDQRVIIVSGIFSRSVKSLNLRTLSDITVNERSNGSGTISFGAFSPMATAALSMPGWPGVEVPPMFYLQSCVREVSDLIRRAQSQV
jgi:hypothetical protein